MSDHAARWRVQLGSEAEQDLERILTRTRESFGARQVDIYAATLLAALAALEDGPDIAGNRRRDEIRPGLRTLHVARGGRRGRHFVMYLAGSGVIEVLRILHDAMDLARHVAKVSGGDDAK